MAAILALLTIVVVYLNPPLANGILLELNRIATWILNNSVDFLSRALREGDPGRCEWF